MKKTANPCRKIDQFFKQRERSAENNPTYPCNYLSGHIIKMHSSTHETSCKAFPFKCLFAILLQNLGHTDIVYICIYVIKRMF